MRPFPECRFSVVVMVGLMVMGCRTAHSAAPPSWATQYPADPAFYPGVGLCEKKGLSTDQYRRAAEDKALADLASQIAVNIQAEFIQKVIEVTGMTREDVQSTIRTATKARLRGHERVGVWEDRPRYWVYYRLAKTTYEQELLKDMQSGMAAAEDMFAKARAEERRDPVLALKYTLDAVEKLGYIVGQPPPRGYAGQSPLLLANTLYTSAQSLLSRYRIAPAHRTAPVLAGLPMNEPVTVFLSPAERSGAPIALANLPLRFTVKAGISALADRAQTDAEGVASCHAESIGKADAGKAVVATVDLAALYPVEGPDGFAQYIRARLTAPQATLVLYGCADESDYRWRSEFQDRRVIVLCAYEAGGKAAEWTRMRDEIGAIVKAHGGNVVTPPGSVKPAAAIAWSAAPESRWDTDSADDTLVLVCAASGQFGKRKNPSNTGGEDVQFGGEIRAAVHRNGKPHFSDRFAGTGGWNPMGEQMCMDVLALNVTKRWQSQYLATLGKAP